MMISHLISVAVGLRKSCLGAKDQFSMGSSSREKHSILALWVKTLVSNLPLIAML